jgi:hypothetical protein
MRIVIWCNDWNFIAASNNDGYGSKSHLTNQDGTSGKTLCGKSFPHSKGFPSSTGFCKTCLNLAYRKGYCAESVKTLEEVPSIQED